MTTTPWQRRLQREVLVNVGTNVAANGAIAWLLFRDTATISLWKAEASFGYDLLATGVILAVILGMILIPLQRRALAKTPELLEDFSSDSLPPSSWDFGVLAYRPIPFQLIIYGLSGLLIALATLLVFSISGLTTLTPLQYSVFKGVWTGVLAGLITRQIIVGSTLDILRRNTSSERGSLPL